MNRLAWGLGLAAAAGLVGALIAGDGTELEDGDADRERDDPGSEDLNGMTRKQVLYAKLESLPQLSEDQRLFFMLTAYRESAATWKPTAHNDTASEVAYSAKAFDDDDVGPKLIACAPRERWVIGSGGLFGRLVPYFGLDCLKIFGKCVEPEKIFDADYDIVSACITAAGLQKREAWDKNPTVGVLRTGWGWPAAMGNPPADRIAKYKRDAAKVGLPADFVDRKLDDFPSTPAMLRAMFETLKKGGAVS